MQTTEKQVRIANGTYRNINVKDVVFPLVKDYKHGKTGNFITVDGSAVPGFPDRSIRVKVVDKSEFDYMEDGENVVTGEAAEPETDEQIIDRLRERFSILEDMTYAACDGVVRGMVVTGPPGVGKSFGVEQVLNENRMFDKMAGKRDRFQVIKGASSAIGLYKVLFENADKGSVLVMDDCDTVLHDETSLNLLKAALDSGKKRMLSWNTDSALLRREGIPDRFEFKGSVIFITNLKFEGTRGKLKDHLDAIMSRCHYLDLTLDTMRDKFLRCKQLVADGMLDEYKFEKKQVTQLMNYMSANKENLREVSLRMVTKIADLMKHNPSNWKRYVEVTCMRRVAKG